VGSGGDRTSKPAVATGAVGRPIQQHVGSTCLAALRASALAAALAVHGSRLAVVLYVLADASAGLDPGVGRVGEFAAVRGWRVVEVVVDDRAAGVPRPGWGRVLDLLRGGLAQGVVCADRSAIAVTDAAYLDVLRWLRDRCCFLEQVPSDWVGPP
jgi:hypothetical protein